MQLHPCAIKCILEKQPAAPRLSVRLIYHANSANGGDLYFDELQTTANKHTATFKARIA